MNTTALTVLVVTNTCWIVIAYVCYRAGTKKFHLPSFERGVHYAGDTLIETHHWFGGKSARIMNTLYLCAYFLKEYQHINAAHLREALERMGDRPYTEIPNDELKAYL